FGDTDPATLDYIGAGSSAQSGAAVMAATSQANPILDVASLASSLIPFGPQASLSVELSTPAAQSTAPTHLAEAPPVSATGAEHIRAADVVFAASDTVAHDDDAWQFVPLLFVGFGAS